MLNSSTLRQTSLISSVLSATWVLRSAVHRKDIFWYPAPTLIQSGERIPGTYFRFTAERRDFERLWEKLCPSFHKQVNFKYNLTQSRSCLFHIGISLLPNIVICISPKSHIGRALIKTYRHTYKHMYIHRHRQTDFSSWPNPCKTNS